jgi:hypothetical protein
MAGRKRGALVKSYKRIRGDHADQIERRKAECCEPGRSYAKQGNIGGKFGGILKEGTPIGASKRPCMSVYVR